MRNYFFDKVKYDYKEVNCCNTNIYFIFGINNYRFQESQLLFVNPFQVIENAQHIQESPITFLIGYIINSILNNTSITYWLVVIIGYIYLFTVFVLVEKKN